MGAEATTTTQTTPTPITASQAAASALSEMPGLSEPAPQTTPPTGGQTPPATPPTETPPVTPPEAPKAGSVDALRSLLGVGPEVSDAAIAQAAQQALYRAQEAAEWQQKYQQLEAQYRQAQPKPPEPQKSFWDSQPEWDDALTPLVTTDASGAIKPKDGSPAAIAAAQKAQEYVAWRQQAETRLMRNPKAAIREMMADEIKKQAQEIAQQQAAQLSEQSFVADFLRGADSWMNQRDAQGNVIIGADGRPAPTQAGKMFFDYTNMLTQAGVKDVRQLANLGQIFVAGVFGQKQQPNGQTIQQATNGQTIQNPQQTPQQTLGQQIRAASQGKPPSTTPPLQSVNQELAGLSAKEAMRRVFADVPNSTSASDFLSSLAQ